MQVNELSGADFAAFSNTSRSFDGLAACSGRILTLTGRGAPMRLTGQRITPQLLSLLGVTPQLGCAFTTEEFDRDTIS